MDFYKINLTNAYTTLNLALSHLTRDYDLALYYGCGTGGSQRTLPVRRGTGLETSVYNIGAETGWYYVAVSGYGGAYDPTTSYQLTLNPIPDAHEPDDSCSSPTTLTLGTDYPAQISFRSDSDYYKVQVAQKDVTLVVNLTRPETYDVLLFRGCRTKETPLAVAKRGTAGQLQVTYDVGANIGTYYIRVYSPEGRYGAAPYTVQALVGDPDPPVVRTFILVNETRLAALYGAPAKDAVLARLTALAADPAVEGALLYVDRDPTVMAAYSAWDANPASTVLANAVTAAVKETLWTELSGQSVLGNSYVVIVGDDRVIPFRRLHIWNDTGGNWSAESAYAADYLKGGMASTTRLALADDQTLTDDFYADFTEGGRLYIPDLAIGRLVETPEEITAVVDDFLARNGQVTLDHVAVAAGADFLRDGAQKQCDQWEKDLGKPAVNCSLISDKFSATDLRQVILGAAVDAASINNHAKHSAFQTPATTDNILSASVIAGASEALNGKLFLTLGCHAGLNVPPGESEESGSVAGLRTTRGHLHRKHRLVVGHQPRCRSRRGTDGGPDRCAHRGRFDHSRRHAHAGEAAIPECPPFLVLLRRQSTGRDHLVWTADVRGADPRQCTHPARDPLPPAA